MKDFLCVRKNSICCGDQRVMLRGINLGGWLMMEGYIMNAPNIAEQVFKQHFQKELGPRALLDFEQQFRNHFIQESDLKKIAQWGFNCIRLPFNSRLVERKPFEYDLKGAAYLDQAVRWAKKYKLWIILDLHAACGPQNQDWHSDSLGQATLWHCRQEQERTIALWDFLAQRYQQEKTIAGYDLLNEPVLNDFKLLNKFYHQLIKTIRRRDQNHILFVEGNRWATDLEGLDDLNDENLVLSAHFYPPLEFTFNLIPQLSYPLRSGHSLFDKAAIAKILTTYQKFSQSRGRPILMGEFGVQSRENLYGEADWLKDVLTCFQEFEMHWTYWTYKAIKNSVFPDGIISYYDNPPWVNRLGPRTGWDQYAMLWPKQKKEMIRSWHSDRFVENKTILSTLQTFARLHA